MLLVWRGLGFISALIVLAAILLGVLIDSVAGSTLPRWVVNVGVWLLAAILNGLFASRIGTPAPRILIDKNTHQEVTYLPRNDLFWIPVRYWTFIFIALAVVAAFGELAR